MQVVMKILVFSPNPEKKELTQIVRFVLSFSRKTHL